MIDGVKVVPLRQIVDERGKIMHMLKATDPHFINFGEIYFSCAWPETVKAWHEVMGTQMQMVDVQAGKSTTVDFTFAPGQKTGKAGFTSSLYFLKSLA